MDITSTNLSISDTHSPVVLIDTIPSSEDLDGPANWSVLVLHEDGTVRLLTADLKAQLWNARFVPPRGEGSYQVHTALWIGADVAEKTVLESRPDLLPIEARQLGGYLAMIFKEPLSESSAITMAMYGVFDLPRSPPVNASVSGTGAIKQPLLSHRLPGAGKTWLEYSGSQFSFDPQTLALSGSFGQTRLAYDITGIAPVLTTQFCPPTSLGSSFLRLTPALALCASSDTLSLCDIKYHSIQSTARLEYFGASRKRRRSGNTSASSPRLVMYFGKIRRILALRGNNLLAIDLSRSDAGATQVVRSVDSDLIESVGRGLPENSAAKSTRQKSNLEIGTIHVAPSSDIKRWTESKSQLDELASAEDLAAFEDLMARELCGSSEHVELTRVQLLQLPRSAHYLDLRMLDYLITKSFFPELEPDQERTSSSKSSYSLRLQLAPPRLLQWMSMIGLLTRQRIEQAFFRWSPHSGITIPSNATVNALMDADATYDLAVNYLRNHPCLATSELSYAVKRMLIDVVASATIEEHTLILEETLDTRTIETVADPIASSAGRPIASASDLSHKAQPVPSSTTIQTATALLAALGILGSHPAQAITAQLRAQFDKPNILSLIQVLRQQLFQGGHTSFYNSRALPTPPSSTASSPRLEDTQIIPTTLTLDDIAKLMSSCLDVLGPIAFVTSDESGDFMDRLLPDLASEVALACEGVQDASRLQGVLREAIRYAESSQIQQPSRVIAPVVKDVAPAEQQPGTIVTLYSEPRPEQNDVGATGGFLPLSLHGDQGVSKTKIRKGGGQVIERSKREILGLQNRNVGIYSFQRLVL